MLDLKNYKSSLLVSGTTNRILKLGERVEPGARNGGAARHPAAPRFAAHALRRARLSERQAPARAGPRRGAARRRAAGATTAGRGGAPNACCTSQRAISCAAELGRSGALHALTCAP